MLERVRHKIESVHETMEASGADIHGVGFLLTWWRRAGLRWALTLILMIGGPAGAYSTLAYTAARAIPDWVGDFGVRFDARDTEVHLLSMQIVARDVTLRADQRSEPVFTASEVTFDGSPWTFFKGIFGPGAFYNEITIRKAELHLERSLTGDWNWRDFLDAVPADRLDAAMKGLYRIRGLFVEDLKVIYTEHIPGNSGSGVIQTAQATVYIDDISGSILDLMPPSAPDERPTRFQVKARSADGIVQIKGTAGLFGSHPPAGQAIPAAQIVKTTTGGAPNQAQAVELGGAFYQMNVYLENIGLGAYSQMVPTTRLQPTRGTLRGTLDLGRAATGISCKSNMAAENLEFAPSPKLVPVKAQFDQLQKDLVGFHHSGPFNPCGEDDDQVVDEPPQTATTFTGLLTSFNRQTTKTAPPSVQAFAALDRQQFAGVVIDAAMTEVVNKVTGKLASKVTQMVGAKTGQAIQSSLAAASTNPKAAAAIQQTTEKSGNVVTRGVKGIGGGFKQLFGGGDKDKKDEKKPPKNPS